MKDTCYVAVSNGELLLVAVKLSVQVTLDKPVVLLVVTACMKGQQK